MANEYLPNTVPEKTKPPWDKLRSCAFGAASLANELLMEPAKLTPKGFYNSLREWLDMLSKGIFVEKEGRIEYSNKKLLEMTGYTSQELEQLNCEDLFAVPEEYGMIAEILHQQGHMSNLEIDLLSKTGELIPVMIEGVLSKQSIFFPKEPRYTHIEVVSNLLPNLDGLTKVYNRDYFRRIAKRLLSSKEPMGIVLSTIISKK